MRAGAGLARPTPVKHKGKSYKVIIIGGSENMISKSADEMMDLKAEPHPQLYNVTRVDRNFHSIT